MSHTLKTALLTAAAIFSIASAAQASARTVVVDVSCDGSVAPIDNSLTVAFNASYNGGALPEFYRNYLIASNQDITQVKKAISSSCKKYAPDLCNHTAGILQDGPVKIVFNVTPTYAGQKGIKFQKTCPAGKIQTDVPLRDVENIIRAID